MGVEVEDFIKELRHLMGTAESTASDIGRIWAGNALRPRDAENTTSLRGPDVTSAIG
ncbi:hypothetical protein QNM97_23700 [Gordonia sp. L191]|uniref:hypothetical protein n=1 Tax=Gordonia sp. L191 TaxID=2982699 RepID=UPI0024C0557D|nr:hypothetical protein [Gordonia sp. L191]WHU46924.1 hypothetical protein QNM97_23700 [Gordonia sp. L191]